MITPMDSTSVISPAFTKLTTITVVAEEDWIMVVTRNPVNTPKTRLAVMAERMERSLAPATRWRASLMIFIPYRNIPSEPTSFRKSNSV